MAQPPGFACLAMFLGVEAKRIGQIGGGRRKTNGALDVAMIQSLVRKGRVDDLTHHQPGPARTTVRLWMSPRFRED